MARAEREMRVGKRNVHPVKNSSTGTRREERTGHGREEHHHSRGVREDIVIVERSPAVVNIFSKEKNGKIWKTNK